MSHTYSLKQCFLSAAGLAFLLASAMPSAADTIYTYNGNPYTVFSGLSCPSVCGITATLDLANPIPPNSGSPIAPLLVTPVSFTVTDGSNTITQANDDMTTFDVVTNSSGQIYQWDVSAGYLNGGIQTDITSVNRGSGSSATHDETFAVISYAENTQDPGVWTSRTNSTVPEPSSIFLALAATSLFVLLGCRNRLSRLFTRA